MSEKVNTRRRKMNNESMNSLNSMMNDLKSDQSYVRLTTAKLNDWIINRFYSAYYKKNKQRIISDHFLKREYFKSILNDLDESMDLDSMVKMMQKKIKNVHQNAPKNTSVSTSNTQPDKVNLQG